MLCYNVVIIIIMCDSVTDDANKLQAAEPHLGDVCGRRASYAARVELHWASPVNTRSACEQTKGSPSVNRLHRPWAPALLHHAQG